MTAHFTEMFQSFVCEGDRISVDIEGYTITARIVRDDCPDAPDQRQDGFWPSMVRDDPGWIGEGKTILDLYDQNRQAQKDMEAWRNDEWFYCGLVLSVSVDDILLGDHAASLWGIEANYPGSDNSYLRHVANELLEDALIIARKARAALCATLRCRAAKSEARP